MSITQKDIADHLGLSRQIVGFALSGNPLVADKTRERVLQAATKLGYSANSNQAARSLIAQRYGSKIRKNALAVLMPPFDGEPVRKMPYYASILDGIEIEANELELDLFLHAIRYGHRPTTIGSFMVDGVIGFTTTVQRNEWMNQHGLPLVLIDGHYDGMTAFYADEAAGITLCTQHLIDLGHRRIAYFCQQAQDGHCLGARYDSFNDTMSRCGVNVDRDLIWQECVRMRRESAADAMSEILLRQHQFTAIVCHNDLLAMGVIDALRQAGRRVPEDVSVTGFDDISEAYGFDPVITSVNFDREGMGRQSVRMLYARVDAVATEPLAEVAAAQIVMPVTFATHRSTAAPKTC